MRLDTNTTHRVFAAVLGLTLPFIACDDAEEDSQTQEGGDEAPEKEPEVDERGIILQLPSCDNGNPNKECGDGNYSNNDACTNDCKLAKCGDGFRWAGKEQCDDGNNVDDDSCSNNCKSTCGNGLINPGEQCDDGNVKNTDACVSGCKLAKCGDGYVQQSIEGCDDSNTSNTDSCTNVCKLAVCGDAFVENGVEGCDDGLHCEDLTPCTSNATCAGIGDKKCLPRDTPVCNKDAGGHCKPPTCGDDIVQPGELCDDGSFGSDQCNPDCAPLQP